MYRPMEGPVVCCSPLREDAPMSPLTAYSGMGESRSFRRTAAIRSSTTTATNNDHNPTKKRKRRWGDRLPPAATAAETSNPTPPTLPESTGREAQVQEDNYCNNGNSSNSFRGFRRGRSSSTCRFNQPIFERRHQHEWRCIVCYLWNSNDLKHCNRCKAQEGVDEVGIRKRKSEFAASAQEGRRILPKTLEWPPLFESNGSDYIFDHRSSMFYESRSDFFYDPKSKLYYGNKKKAYFMYTQAKYPPFFQVSGLSSSEQQQEQPQTATLPQVFVSNKSIDAKRSTRSVSATGGGKKDIIIKIRSKSVGQSMERRNHSGATSSPPRRSSSKPKEPEQQNQKTTLNPKQKEQLAAVQKWNQQVQAKRQKTDQQTDELSVQSLLGIGDLKQVVVGLAVSNSHKAKSSSNNLPKQVSISQTNEPPKALHTPKAAVARTSSGQPICLVCMRKFASFEKLTQHETLSELHKANLEKKKQQLQQQQEQQRNEPASVSEIKTATPVAVKPTEDAPKPDSRSPVPSYKDRAQHRRQLYGDDLAIGLAPPAFNKPPEKATKVIRTEVIDPSAAFAETNVGYQLYQRLMQSKTVSLPSSTEGSNGTATAFAAPTKTNDTGIPLVNSLRDHWAQIETLAGRKMAGQRGRGNQRDGKLGLGCPTSTWESHHNPNH